jgi:hypothetical protein
MSFIRYVLKNRTDYLSESSVSFQACSKHQFWFDKLCLLVNDLFKVNTKQGNNIKLDSIPKASVMAINPPRATVPPNLKA